jgi:hypothetical protein
MSQSLRAALVGLILVEGAARADVIPPTAESCRLKPPGEACTFQGRRGVCRLVSNGGPRRPDGSRSYSYNFVDCALPPEPEVHETGAIALAKIAVRERGFRLRLVGGLAVLGLGVLLLRLSWRGRARAGTVED